MQKFQPFTPEEANRLFWSLEEVRDVSLQFLEGVEDIQSAREAVIMKWWNRIGKDAYNNAMLPQNDVAHFDSMILLSSIIDEIFPNAWEVISKTF